MFRIMNIGTVMFSSSSTRELAGGPRLKQSEGIVQAEIDFVGIRWVLGLQLMRKRLSKNGGG